MKIPKAEHHIGDAVTVAIEEAGCPPSFDARVCGIQINRHGQIEYEVVEDNGARSDGYTERWLTAKAPNKLRCQLAGYIKGNT